MKRIIKKLARKPYRYITRILRGGDPIADAFTTQAKLIKTPQPVIFDIGANVGYVTTKYRDLFPGASIHSFEPFPESFEKLLHNVDGDPHIHCHQLAVSENKGRAFFNANFSSATNSLLATDKRGGAYWGQELLETTSRIEVETTTIDDFIFENGIPYIDILKVDVQGAEFAVFSGARNTLKNQKISLIYTELIICPTYEGQHKLHEYLIFLDSHGYEFLDFFNPVRRHNQLLQADLVFLSTSRKKELGDLRPLADENQR